MRILRALSRAAAKYQILFKVLVTIQLLLTPFADAFALLLMRNFQALRISMQEKGAAGRRDGELALATYSADM